MVDDRDVVRREPLGEVLRAPVDPGAAGELDEGAHWTLERNSRPPSIRCSSSRRSASASRSIRVWVGSPGTFSTRKWRSARLAICGRWVIVTTWARLAEPLEGAADRVRRLAADAGVDLVEDHRLAAADRRDRERDARQLAARGRVGDRCERQARGSAGSGTTTSSAPVGPGSRSRSSTAELALPHADAAQLLGDRLLERAERARHARPGARTASSTGLRLRGGELLGGGAGRVVACLDRLQLAPGLGGAREQLLVARAVEAALRVGDPVEARLDLLEPARARPRARRGRRAARSPSRAGGARRRAARSPARSSSGASRSSGATARSASAARPAAPSPSSGASASAAALPRPRRAR